MPLDVPPGGWSESASTASWSSTRRRTLPIGILSLTDSSTPSRSRRARRPTRVATRCLTIAAAQGRRDELKEAHEARLVADGAAGARHRRLRRGFRPDRSCPAYRRGIADRELPGRRRASPAASSRPGTAATRDFSRLAPRIPEFARGAVRRLHGLRQRLPGHARSSASSSRVASWRPRRHVRGRPAGRGAAPPTDRPATSPTTQKYGDVPAAARRSSAARSASSWTPATARAAASASRSAPRSATTRWS